VKRGKNKSPDLSHAPAAVALDTSEIMTLHDTATYLNCHYQTLFRLVRSGEIPAFRVGVAWRCSRPDIDQWIAHRHASVAEETPSKPERRGRPKKVPAN
jgi:excisionase family DNA binding protein